MSSSWLQYAKNKINSLMMTTFNQLQSNLLVCMEVNYPFFSGLTKKLVDMSGDSRERQWFHERLFQAVVRGNQARRQDLAAGGATFLKYSIGCM